MKSILAVLALTTVIVSVSSFMSPGFPRLRQLEEVLEKARLARARQNREPSVRHEGHPENTATEQQLEELTRDAGDAAYKRAWERGNVAVKRTLGGKIKKHTENEHPKKGLSAKSLAARGFSLNHEGNMWNYANNAAALRREATPDFTIDHQHSMWEHPVERTEQENKEMNTRTEEKLEALRRAADHSDDRKVKKLAREDAVLRTALLQARRAAVERRDHADEHNQHQHPEKKHTGDEDGHPTKKHTDNKEHDHPMKKRTHDDEHDHPTKKRTNDDEHDHPTKKHTGDNDDHPTKKHIDEEEDKHPDKKDEHYEGDNHTYHHDARSTNEMVKHKVHKSKMTTSSRRRSITRRQSNRVSFRECQVIEGDRQDCGTYGITEIECYSRGCCWGESQTAGVPWCFHSLPALDAKCSLPTDDRVECGYYGIRRETCLYESCCWQPTDTPGASWCYHKLRVPIFAGECGVPAIPPSVSLMNRIVGGVDAVPHSWPWMVSLQNGDHFCGGTLINSKWVVSAAHCAPGFEWGSSRYVIVGNHHMYEKEAMEVEIEVEEVITHENYDDWGYDSDIMLLKLAQEVTFSDEVSPACLPEPRAEYQPGQHCYATGWGNTEWQGDMPEILQQVMLPLISQDDCNEDEAYGGKITENMLCAGYEEGGRDSCQGDSGGPLVCYNQDNESWELTGVVSWGEACAMESKPGVYTNVANFIGWIEETISNNEKRK